MTRQALRNIVRRVLAESHQINPDQTYRCFGGSVVPFGSSECIDDIRMRMDDALETRDACDNRTDKRVTYNGLLQMLRRELRAAERASAILYPPDEEGQG